MERDSFIFYRTWVETIKQLPEELQAKAFLALCDYALNGIETIINNVPINVLLSMAKLRIDEDRNNYFTKKERYKNAAERRWAKEREKGDIEKIKRSKTQCNAVKRSKTHSVNVNDNDNVNVNDNDNVIKENIHIKENENNIQSSLFPTDEQPTPQQPPRTLSEHERLLEYIHIHAPYIATHYKHLITEEEMRKLLREYSKQEIANTIDNIENRQDLRKKYVNLYRTLLNWLKNDSINKRP